MFVWFGVDFCGVFVFFWVMIVEIEMLVVWRIVLMKFWGSKESVVGIVGC